MKVFVLAETADAARELAAGARCCADDVVLVSVGVEPVCGVANKVAHIAVPQGFIVEDAYASVNKLFDAESPSVVYVEPTRRMKALAGRLGAHVGDSAITDVISFDGQAATNLYFGGVGMRTSKAAGEVALFTVGAGVFGDAEASGTDVVEEIAFEAPAKAVKLISSKEVPATDVDLSKTDMVVGAGRGFAEEADLDYARDLCNKIGAGLGCTRPLTEGVGWMPKGTYLGVSGLMLAPKVYIACGISGQMQHMVGVNRADVIVAINKDKNAPIFKQCDFGIVGDVKTVLPALTAAL